MKYLVNRQIQTVLADRRVVSVFRYMHRTVNKTDLPTLMHMFNHSSQMQTLEYLCIPPEEIREAYMFEL